MVLCGWSRWQRTRSGRGQARWLQPLLTALGHSARRAMCPLYVASLLGLGEPSLPQIRPRLGCLTGTFRPLRRQIRSTRLSLTSQPAAFSNDEEAEAKAAAYWETQNRPRIYRWHSFAWACEQTQIEHRLTKPRCPWTADEVEQSLSARAVLFSVCPRVTA